MLVINMMSKNISGHKKNYQHDYLFLFAEEITRRKNHVELGIVIIVTRNETCYYSCTVIIKTKIIESNNSA